jgi:hypothetical protein
MHACSNTHRCIPEHVAIQMGIVVAMVLLTSIRTIHSETANTGTGHMQRKKSLHIPSYDINHL